MSIFDIFCLINLISFNFNNNCCYEKILLNILFWFYKVYVHLKNYWNIRILVSEWRKCKKGSSSWWFTGFPKCEREFHNFLARHKLNSSHSWTLQIQSFQEMQTFCLLFRWQKKASLWSRSLYSVLNWFEVGQQTNWF